MLSRTVSREVLDDLAEDDPRAMRSRRDLQRIHVVMRTRAIVSRALQDMTVLRRSKGPLRILELGAGDGTLMLEVAQALKSTRARVHITLLDAQPLITPDTIARYAALGWTATACVRDVFDWANHPTGVGRRNPHARWDIIVANLFLHHFEGPQLSGLLRTIANRSDRFLACEPRRAWLALGASHLIGALGTNAVTRNDAVLSVHAGFRGSELTAMWPDVGDTWQVMEYPAGLFSHCFRAEPIRED